jgi:hypothetical protein
MSPTSTSTRDPQRDVDETLRRRFEAAWLQGTPGRVEDFLPPADDAQYLPTLVELVCIDLEFSRQPPSSHRDGQDPPPVRSIEEYLARFPVLDEPEILYELVGHEIQLRRRDGGQREFTDYQRRFPQIADRLSAAAAHDETQTAWGQGAAVSVPSAQSAYPSRMGNYELLEKIGQGGMGCVYLARHVELRTQVAVKILHAATADSPEMITRLRHEGRAAAILRHEHIAAAIDAGMSDGLYYVVFEYVEGIDLARLVQQDGPLPVAKAIDYARQTALALQFAHEHGFVHRDVKPANLMVDSCGRIRVLDLGLATITGPLAHHVDWTEVTQADAFMGSVDYMAPEQGVDPRQVDQRADVYGLGCTLFSLLTGRKPYSGRSLIDRLIAHREQPVPSLGATRDPVPSALERLIQQMMAKQVDKRVPSMQEVVRRLDAIRVALGKSPNHRNRMVGLGLLVLFVLAGMMVAMWAPRPVGRKTVTEEPLVVAEPSAAARKTALSILELGGSMIVATEEGQRTIATQSDLPELPFRIEQINFSGATELTDAQLISTLQDCPDVRVVNLEETQVTAQGVKQMVMLRPELIGLNLNDLALNDDNIQVLMSLKKLHSLWLVHTEVGDRGVEMLSGLPTIEYLWMGNSAVTDEGIAHLVRLPSLYGLGLERTRVTARGLRHLFSSRLLDLHLDGVSINDEDIELLSGLGGLRLISLRDTGLTPNGIDRLREVLPGCTILY